MGALEVRTRDLEHKEARAKEDEERLCALRRDLDEQQRRLNERDDRYSKAVQEAYHAPKISNRRFSPRSGNNNKEVQQDLEEQQQKMQDIKRKAGTWQESPPPALHPPPRAVVSPTGSFTGGLTGSTARTEFSTGGILVDQEQ